MHFYQLLCVQGRFYNGSTAFLNVYLNNVVVEIHNGSVQNLIEIESFLTS